MKIPTPPLPFELPINCKLILNDSQILEACLRYTRDKTSYQDLPGIDESRQQIRMRLVNPKLLPESVKVNTRMIAEITDNSTGIITKHILIVLKIIQSQWKESANSYGAVLHGVLIQANSDSQVDNVNPFGD
jgi:hypothetical protein